MRIGVLGIQGAFREHIAILSKLDVTCQLVKTREALQQVDALILPGGESTVMAKFLSKEGLDQAIVDRVSSGMPIWGTCAGLILLAKEVEDNPSCLNLMDIEVKRNAYGRQLGSFVTEDYFSDMKIPMVFIRGPIIKAVENQVEVLSKVNNEIVAVRQNHMLATSFHPELTKDFSVHEYFIKMCQNV